MTDSSNLSPSLLSSSGERWAPSSGKTTAGMGPGCFALFFLIFLIVGICLLYFMFYRSFQEFRAMQTWPEVPCEIIGSRLKTHRDSDGHTTYSPHITYRYEWKGQQYTSERYQIFNYSSSFRRAHERVVHEYPVGRRTICYVNPDNPAEAILDRSRAPGLWVVFIVSVAFILVGGGGVAGSLYYAARRKENKAVPLAQVQDESALRFSPLVSDTAWPAPTGPTASTDGTAGPVTLSPKQSRFAALLVAGVIAVLWNGVLSVFVSLAIHGFQQGKPPWFLTIFLIPFVVVGLGLLVAVVYTFLTLFNPVPQITLQESVLRLGGPLPISWQFLGSTSRIRKLTIRLVGEEVATYLQGTATATERSPFFRQVLFESSTQREIISGRAETLIPLHLMHSWKAPNNQIEWYLEVHGDIPFFPDVKDTFLLDVRPAQLWEDVWE